MQKIRLVLASNHELWWEGLTLLLAEEEDLESVALCYDAAAVLHQVKENPPDVVLLDEEIAGCDCGALVQEIADIAPAVKVILAIKPFKNVTLATCQQARVKGYVDKDITYTDLTDSIRQVAKGGLVIFSPRVAEEFIEHVSTCAQYKVNVRMDTASNLSNREREVLTLLATESMTNREIAEKLFITESTVKGHLSNILGKMKVRNRHEAALIARKNIRFNRRLRAAERPKAPLGQTLAPALK